MNKYFGMKTINNINLITLLFSELSIEDAEDFRKGLFGLVKEEENKFIINAKQCDFLMNKCNPKQLEKYLRK